jgi:hypothetical protein
MMQKKKGGEDSAAPNALVMPEGLEIAIENLSVEDANWLAGIDNESARVMLFNRKLAANPDDQATINQLLELTDPERAEKIKPKLFGLYARVVTRLPVGWLVPGAPDLPTSDAALYDHLQASKANKLRQAIGLALAEALEGN